MNDKELLYLRVRLNICLRIVRDTISLGDKEKIHIALLKLEIAQRRYEKLYEKISNFHDA